MPGTSRRVKRMSFGANAAVRGPGVQGGGRRGNKALLVLAALAVLVVIVASRRSSSPEVKQLPIGSRAATSAGYELTVHSWKSAGSSPTAKEKGLSAIEIESCRTAPDRPLLKAGAFSLEMPDGKSLEPQGSDLTTSPDCVRGEIFFPATADTKPRSVLYSAGSPRLSWTVDEDES